MGATVPRKNGWAQVAATTSRCGERRGGGGGGGGWIENMATIAPLGTPALFAAFLYIGSLYYAAVPIYF